MKLLSKRTTHRKFAQSDIAFRSACKLLEKSPTRVRARKFRRERGEAYHLRHANVLYELQNAFNYIEPPSPKFNFVSIFFRKLICKIKKEHRIAIIQTELICLRCSEKIEWGN